MTLDEQEALSFRYVAPRVFRLSSGNIAIVPMIGRGAPNIVTPQVFAEFWRTLLPNIDDLETLNRVEDHAMRQRAASMNAPRKPAPTKATLDDLA